MDQLTISGLAQMGHVGVETVRYYQRLGLLAQPDRGAGIRRYGSDDVRRLRFIRSAKAAGFTLEQIGELLALDSTNDRRRAHALAQERIAALDETIAQLQAARTSLRKLAGECGSGTKGPCPIILAFEGR